MASERSVLVTGARGLIGSAAVEALVERGWTVHGVSRQATSASGSVIWHSADLLDSAATRSMVERLRCSVLLHLAWVTESPAYWSSPKNLDWVLASLDLMKIFASSGGRRVVCAGTCAEYEWANSVLVEDRSLLGPATVYGRAKAALYWLASDWARSRGVSLAWGRVFFTFGPFEQPSRLASGVLRSLLAGSPANVTDCEQVRDLLYSKDLGDAFAHLVEHDIEGGVNLCSGQGVPLRDLVESLAAAIGRPDLIRYGAVPRRSDEASLVVGDCTRLRNTGWHPRWTMQGAAHDLVAWWLKQER